MNSRRIPVPVFLLLAGAVGVIVAAALLPSRPLPSQPQWDGTSLSQWMAKWYNDPAAKGALRNIGTNGLPFYIRWMEEPGWERKSWALRGFETLGPAARPAIPELIRLLPLGGNYVSWSLAGIGPEAVPALTNFIATNEVVAAPARRRWTPWRARYNALAALQFMGTNAEPALPTLLMEWRTGRKMEANVAAEALPLAGKHRPDLVVPSMLQVLEDDSTGPDSKATAAEILGAFGSQAGVAIPALSRACQDTNRILRINASAALKQISPSTKDALAPLIECLRDPSALVRQEAAVTLEKLGTNASDAFPMLVERSLRDPLPEVRRAAISCVRMIGICSEEVLARLAMNLTNSESIVRSTARGAIVGFAEHCQPAFDFLLCQKAKDDIAQLSYKNRSLLLNSFTNSNAEVRYQAFRALGYMGAIDPRDSIPALKKALNDPEERIRTLATNYLERLL